MTRAVETGYVAECFWTGVREEDLHDLDLRIEACVTGSAAPGEAVRHLGTVLIVDDEVVLCMFEGQLDAVRRVAECAGIPFERILRTVRAPWPRAAAPEERL